MFHNVFTRSLFLIVLVTSKCDAFIVQPLCRGNILNQHAVYLSDSAKDTPQFRTYLINYRSVYLTGATKDTDQDFWDKQKELVAEIQQKSNRSLQEEQKESFAKRRLGLLRDTAYFGFFIFCALWSISDNPFTALSYSFGATMGLAYAFGLGKSVETLGGSADDVEALKGAGVGEARFAFLIILLIVVGKFRAQGLEPIPSIAGFFTYQLASLSQGLREFND